MSGLFHSLSRPTLSTCSTLNLCCYSPSKQATAWVRPPDYSRIAGDPTAQPKRSARRSGVWNAVRALPIKNGRMKYFQTIAVRVWVLSDLRFVSVISSVLQARHVGSHWIKSSGPWRSVCRKAVGSDDAKATQRRKWEMYRKATSKETCGLFSRLLQTVDRGTSIVRPVLFHLFPAKRVAALTTAIHCEFSVAEALTSSALNFCRSWGKMGGWSCGPNRYVAS